MAWTAVVAAEFLGAQTGLGQIIVYSQYFGYVDRMFVVAIFLLFYAALTYALFERASRRLTEWVRARTDDARPVSPRHDDGQLIRRGGGRDLWGYGSAKPTPNWPGDARVAVSFVVNFEEGAEFSVADGDDRNEAIYEVEHRVVGMPDPCLDSHFEYGARAGWWRVMDVLAAHGVQATVSACGRAVERLPVAGARRDRARA